MRSRRLTQPDHIHWCDGSDAEYQVLQRELIAAKELLPLNPQSFPGCVLSRSNPSDVARVEHLTFVCTKNKDDAGPNNHWIAPAQAHAQMDALFAGCMKGALCTWFRIAWVPSTRRFPAAASKSPTAPTWCST
jgi:phosphoenolpyruvate carboxykinase (GTP)